MPVRPIRLVFRGSVSSSVRTYPLGVTPEVPHALWDGLFGLEGVQDDQLLTGVLTDARSEDSGSSVNPSNCSTVSTERDTWTDHNRGSIMYNIYERRVDIRRLYSVHHLVEGLLDRRKRLHAYLSDLLEKKESRMECIKKLKKLKQSSEEWRSKGYRERHRLTEITERWQLRQRSTTDNLSSLVTATAFLSVNFTVDFQSGM